MRILTYLLLIFMFLGVVKEVQGQFNSKLGTSRLEFKNGNDVEAFLNWSGNTLTLQNDVGGDRTTAGSE